MIHQAQAYLQWELEPKPAPRDILREPRRRRSRPVYRRDHEWMFGCGARMQVTDRLLDVPTKCFDSQRPSSEEAFVAAVASSHMMAFLAIAAELGVIVTSYFDKPAGVLMADEDGEIHMIEIVLNPNVTYGDVPATPAAEQELHERAKLRSVLGKSVTATITVYSAAEFAMAPQ